MTAPAAAGVIAARLLRAGPVRAWLLAGLALALTTGTVSAEDMRPDRRAFDPRLEGRWIGCGIAYGPHRDGQAPGGRSPSRAELAEDLRLLSRRWNLLRVYGALDPTPGILEVIRAEHLPLRVALGVWLVAETRRDSTGAVVAELPEGRRANRRQVRAAIRLARRHPDLVIAVLAGNETQVAWSDHRVPRDELLRHLRALRAAVRQPVSTADDHSWWRTPESLEVARELDFLTVHAHPLWNGRTLEDAAPWTLAVLDSVRAVHPDAPLALGETGWATRRHVEGEEARLMRGVTGEPEQLAYLRAMTEWSWRTGTTMFFFEAFDENWKGGEHPDGVEKHWGLYRADRSPKRAVQEEGGHDAAHR